MSTNLLNLLGFIKKIKHYLFLKANFIKAALDQGEIPKKIKAIPKSKFIRELKYFQNYLFQLRK